jgi:trans-aconitate methyltransferase
VTVRQLWDDRHRASSVEALSWFQRTPVMSLELIELLGVDRRDGVIDVGGGVSTLAGELLCRGFEDVTVLDVSREALAWAAARLPGSDAVSWLEADVRTWRPARTWRLWHDRAVLHFLTAAEDRHAYLRAMGQAVAPGGGIIIGAFAPDGPDHCSGLPTERYDAAALLDTIGSHVPVDPVASKSEVNVTPDGAE